jgi:hypothetical protein
MAGITNPKKNNALFWLKPRKHSHLYRRNNEMNDDELIDSELDLSEVDGPIQCKPVITNTRGKKRKPKVSKVPVEYDPFRELNKTPEGYARPEQKCWVSPAIARPIDMPKLSPLWRQDPTQMGTSDRRHRFLASVVASVNGEFYVRRRDSGMWTAVKKTAEVRNLLWNEWGAEETELNIRLETIKAFLADDAYVVLDQLAYIPGAGLFVEYRGRKCLNTYHERPLAFPTDTSISPETNLLMEMIVKNLLNHQDGEIDDWLVAIASDEKSPIRWMFHWLASQYQRPGKALPTALWFVGPAQGIGKGQFTNGMKLMLGSSNVKGVSVEEFKGEWTDFLSNASLFILDEVDFSSRKEANSKLKRLVGNETLSARKRNVGEFEVPSVANFVFTTNNIRPLALDRDDRRNTFFETCGTAEAKQRAQQYYALGSIGQQTAWEGLVSILSAIDIDERLISRALETDVKRRMIDAGQEPFEEWLLSDETIERWKLGEFAPIQWIKDNYVEWARANAYPGCSTSSYCKNKLEEMVSEGRVSSKFRKTLNDGTKPWGYVRVDVDNPITMPDDCDAIAVHRASKSLMETRKKIAANRPGIKLTSIKGGAA